MLRKIRWKFTLIAVLIVLSILILLPLASKIFLPGGAVSCPPKACAWGWIYREACT